MNFSFRKERYSGDKAEAGTRTIHAFGGRRAEKELNQALLRV